MARRSYQQAADGQVYAVEWPEWHVTCAAADCEVTCHVSACGECMTAREADARLKRGDVEDCAVQGRWHKSHGLWYCPIHLPR